MTVKVIGLKKFLESFKKIPEVVEQSVKEQLYDDGTKIMNDSKKNYVPVSTGTLRKSGFVELPKKEGKIYSVDIGYGGPAKEYALRVHENPRAGKTHGISPSGKPYPRTAGGKPTWAVVGQWKFLEIPFKNFRTRKRVEMLKKKLKARIKKNVAR